MKINILRYKEAQDNERECWETAHGNLDLALEMLNKRYSKLIGMFEAETQLKENYKILDVGCGPTYISRLFTKGEKYGIDPLLMFYARIFKNQKSVISIQAAGEQMPFKNQSFELCSSRNVLDHSYSPEVVLKEIKWVTKQNGYLLIAIYTYTPFIKSIKVSLERMGVPGLREIPHPHFFSPPDFEDIMSKYFSIVSRHIVHNGKNWRDFGRPRDTKKKIHVKIQQNLSFWKMVKYLYLSVISFVNRYILRNEFYVRELMIIGKNNK